jgi:putative PEP-CTERM system TPR-repeat lipoprotein
LRGATHKGLDQPAESRKDFEQALARDPAYFPAIESLAALDVADSKIDQAIKRFESVLARQPSNLQAQLAIAGLTARKGAKTEEVAKLLAKAIRTNPTEPTPRLNLIELHISTRQWGAALNAAQEAVAALPASPELLDALGRVQAMSGDANQARASFNKLAAMQPGSPVPHVRLADMLTAAKNPDAAAQSLARALEIQPDFLEAQRKLAALEVKAGKYPAALKIAKTVQTQRPRQDAGYLLEGDVQIARKDVGAAVNAYQAGLKASPSTPVAIKLHATLVHAGRRADADAVAATWLKERPADTAFMNHLGLVALQQQSYEQAQRQFAAIVQRAPRHAPALNNLAWSMVQQAKPQALEYATRANEINPNQPAMMETLALALSLNGQLPQAVELQKKVVQLQPANNSFRLSLAKLYVQAGQPEQAKTELAILSSLGDKFAGQPEVARMLKSL